MERVNLKGGLSPKTRTGDIQLVDVETFASTSSDKLIYDTREPEGFAGGHIECSYNIWLDGMPVFGGWIGDEHSHIYLVTDRDYDVDTAALHLARIGIDNVEGALAGGFGTWRSSGKPIHKCGVITPRELAEDLNRFNVLDVREFDEYAQGHIPGAKHMYVGILEGRFDELDLDRQRPVVVTCSVGHRSGLGASILLRKGCRDVRNLLGGMTAWTELGLPME